uniref:Uncharacterized protein n=1 Tax=Rhizophagus irregularis (strain DAOM 181602 / DAOM 197198 / MUCL 43194) TaxID=747089 RepID=U9UZX2_RHIID
MSRPGQRYEVNYLFRLAGTFTYCNMRIFTCQHVLEKNIANMYFVKSTSLFFGKNFPDIVLRISGD